MHDLTNNAKSIATKNSHGNSVRNFELTHDIGNNAVLFDDLSSVGWCICLLRRSSWFSVMIPFHWKSL